MREERRVIDGYESDYARDGSRLNFITEIVSWFKKKNCKTDLNHTGRLLREKVRNLFNYNLLSDKNELKIIY